MTNQTYRQRLWLVLAMLMCSLALAPVAKAKTIRRPYNSSILAEHGIDGKLLDLPLRFFDQGVASTERVRMVQQSASGDVEHEASFDLVSDPFGPAGVETYVRYSKGQSLPASRKQLRHLLEDLMAIHFVARDSSHVYDADSVHLIHKDEHRSVIGFSYQADLLYGSAGMFKNLEGQLVVEQGQPHQLILSSYHPYRSGGKRYDSLRMVIELAPVQGQGGYLIKGYTITEHRADGGQVLWASTTLEHTKPSGDSVAIEREQPLTIEPLDPAVSEEARVKVARTLPFFGKEVRKMGFQLPKPYGIQLFNHNQSDLMDFTNFELDGLNLNDMINPNGSTSVNHTDIMAIRGDVWILPFMSLNAMVGRAHTRSDITLKGGEDGVPNPVDPIAGEELLAPGEEVKLNGLRSSSTIVGVGTTLAMGYQNVFTSVDIMYVHSMTDDINVATDAVAITPLVGYDFRSTGLRLVAGGQYQQFNTTLEGDLDIGRFKVDQKVDKWTGMLGLQKTFWRDWEASLMYNTGKSRQSLTFIVGKRF